MNQDNRPLQPEGGNAVPNPSDTQADARVNQPPKTSEAPGTIPNTQNGYTAEWNARSARTADQGRTTPVNPPYGNQTGNFQPGQQPNNQNYHTPQSAPAWGQTGNPYQRPNPYQGNPGFQGGAGNGGFPPPSSGFSYTAAPQPAPKAANEAKYASRSSLIAVVVLCILLSIGCGIGGVCLGIFLQDGDNGTSAILSGNKVNITHYDSDYSAEQLTDGTVASVVTKVSPAVVEIYTDTVTYSSYYGQQITSGAGSGVVISEDGYIITCAHVIDGADKITVRLKDGAEYEASVVGSDSQTDIAVIKIKASGKLSCVGFGSSDNLVVGQPVIAVGNPLGSLGGTVTTGIISATGREIEIEGQLYTLLQTNAAINSGNSGGGLFDMNGNLIGVVNAKSSGDSIEGLGFAIPSTQAEDIAAQLIAYGYVKGRPVIGITLLNVNSQEVIMNYLQYSRFFTEYGVYIIESEHDSLELGDRIVAIDGTEISKMSDIQQILSGKKVGETIKITVSRLNGRRSELVDVQITLREKTVSD